MTVKIYLNNLSRYVDGVENGRWLQLPMDSNKLQSIYNDIVGKDQEHIILEYDAPFYIDEYENVLHSMKRWKIFQSAGLMMIC